MQAEFIAVPPAWNVGQAIDYMRETAELPEHFYELYITDETSHFLGAVPLDRLLRSKRPVPISDLMEAERRRVHADEDQEEVARLFQRYDLVAARWSTPTTGWLASSPSTTWSTSSRRKPKRTSRRWAA